MQNNTNDYSIEYLKSLIGPSFRNEGFNTFDFLSTIQKNLITEKQRKDLIILITKLCYKFNISSKVEQSAIYILDDFLSKEKITLRSKLNIISMTILFIALEYESRKNNRDAILTYFKNHFNAKYIEYTEHYILKIIGWTIGKNTPYEIIRVLIDFTNRNLSSELFFKETDNYTRIALSDYSLSQNSPLNLAVSSAICALIRLGQNNLIDEWIQISEITVGTNLDICHSIARKILDR